jgi:hypothetical protein
MSIRPGDQELARPFPRRLRVARLVGELLSPPTILAVLALVIAWDSSPTPAMAILWGGIAAVSASLLLYTLILRGVRRGRLSDRNISLREQRIRFAAVAITSILTGLAVLAAFDAPAEMVALQASIASGWPAAGSSRCGGRSRCTQPSPLVPPPCCCSSSARRCWSSGPSWP